MDQQFYVELRQHIRICQRYAMCHMSHSASTQRRKPRSWPFKVSRGVCLSRLDEWSGRSWPKHDATEQDSCIRPLSVSIALSQLPVLLYLCFLGLGLEFTMQVRNP